MKGNFQMRFTWLICGFFFIVSLVSTQGLNPVLLYGACLIDEQLYFFEMMLDTWKNLDVGSDFGRLMENKHPPEEIEKRKSLMENCVKKMRDRMFYFVKNNNAHTGNIFRMLMPEGEAQYEPGLTDRLMNDYMQQVTEMKLFFSKEVPNYYYELGKNMGINFTEAEIKRNEKIISNAQEKSRQEILNISRQLGITDMPKFDNISITDPAQR